MVDKTDVVLSIGANSDQFISALDHVIQATKAGTASASAAFKHLAGVAEESGGEVIDQQAKMSESFAEMQAQMKAAMADFAAGVQTVMSELWEKVKTDSKAAAIALGVAFTAVGLGAVYTAYKVIKASAEFITGLFTGDAYKSENVDKLRTAAAQMETLREKLNLTREAASALAIAFDSAGVKQEEWFSASGQLQSAIEGNNEAFRAMGINTQDTGNHLKDFVANGEQVVKKLEEFEIGYQRDSAARDAGLPSYKALKEALKVTEEQYAKAYDEAARFSLFIGNDVAAEMKRYDDTMREFKHQSDLTWNGFSRAIADGVMPILTDLAEFFKEGMPAVVSVTRVVVGSVVMVFHGFVQSIYAVTEGILGAIKAAGEGIAGLGKAIVKAMQGDFQGAWAELKSGGDRALGELGNSYNNIAARAEEAGKKIRMAFNGGQQGSVQTASGPGKNAPTFDKAKEERGSGAAHHESRLAAFEANLSAIKSEYMLENDLRQFSLEQEKQYWDSLLNLADLTEKEKGQIMKKSADLKLQILQKTAAEEKAIAQEGIDEYARLANFSVEQRRIAAREEYDLGLISKTQLLEQDRQFEQERYEIQRTALDLRLALLEKDPNTSPVEYAKLKNQMLEIDRQHALAQRQIEAQVKTAAPGQQVFKSMQSSFEQAITGMITRAQTLRQGLNNIFQSIFSTFVQKMVAEPLARFAASLIQQSGLYQAFFGVKAGMEATSAATGVGITAAESAAKITAIAPVAAAGAASSQAAIPVIGPALAMGAAAMMLAFVMGLGGKGGGSTSTTTGPGINMGKGSTPSAAGGFDIPAGVNPLTQLHEREMVLPAEHADTIRSMKGGGDNGAVHLHVHSLDTGGVKDFLRRNSHVMAPGLRNLARNMTSSKA